MSCKNNELFHFVEMNCIYFFKHRAINPYATPNLPTSHNKLVNVFLVFYNTCFFEEQVVFLSYANKRPQSVANIGSILGNRKRIL